ncbi:D-xylose proton-symporter [Ligilactobacillus ruminis]|uniref:D-xylose proton-symporter n=2 Tax=Ligilactobacillus ruminis TaxID=1623 RepID=A0A837IU97_9LACO|nr:D-xylose proton-symporter [Ligilactobacillus ruminis]
MLYRKGRGKMDKLNFDKLTDLEIKKVQDEISEDEKHVAYSHTEPRPRTTYVFHK